MKKGVADSRAINQVYSNRRCIMSINILIADDDSVFRNLICDILQKQGYIPIPAKNGREALDTFFSESNIALCILDVMMPIYNGWEVLEEIRQHSDVPIIMLTALGDEHHEIKGLLHGADDYIAKPFSYPLFIARIEAALRKTKKELSHVITAGKISINPATHRVLVDGMDVVLNHKEFLLLSLFMTNKGIVFDRDKILDRIWGFDFEGGSRTVDSHIKMLRAKLDKYGDYIITIRGTGYKFEVSDEKEH